MPAAIAIPAIASVIGGGAATIGQIHGQNQANSANREALQYERQREEERKREFDMQQAQARAQYGAYQQQLAPYRALAIAAMAKRYGVNPQTLAQYAGFGSGGGFGNFGGGGQNPLMAPGPGAYGSPQVGAQGHPGVGQYGRTIADLGLQDADPSRRADLAYNQNQRQV